MTYSIALRKEGCTDLYLSKSYYPRVSYHTTSEIYGACEANGGQLTRMVNIALNIANGRKVFIVSKNDERVNFEQSRKVVKDKDRAIRVTIDGKVGYLAKEVWNGKAEYSLEDALGCYLIQEYSEGRSEQAGIRFAKKLYPTAIVESVCLYGQDEVEVETVESVAKEIEEINIRIKEAADEDLASARKYGRLILSPKYRNLLELRKELVAKGNAIQSKQG